MIVNYFFKIVFFGLKIIIIIIISTPIILNATTFSGLGPAKRRLAPCALVCRQR